MPPNQYRSGIFFGALSLSAASFFAALRKLKNLPILFIHGLCDRMIPYELSVKVSKMCENSKLELIENGDHGFYNDINALNKAIKVSTDFTEDILL